MADRLVVSYDELAKVKKSLEQIKQTLDDFYLIKNDVACMGNSMVINAYGQYADRMKSTSVKYSKKAEDFASMLGNVLEEVKKLDNDLAQKINQAIEKNK
ncbi:hypothetical protein [Bombiscardovia coagulans]|uniref:Uncharacterized protein n=1 Tax=Bombiscardovia coagulans TaxID=686666 RepID=A0A261EUT7_9BIFI|nr:hypothetical protein [Bombiscardovia coagulans]OZG50595.1 hypothetical protein BOCO_0195 [Bombiscardovia coagulans]